MARTPVLSQGPLFCSIRCHRLCSYCRQDVLLFGFGDYGLEKYQLFCGRAMGPVKQ